MEEPERIIFDTSSIFSNQYFLNFYHKGKVFKHVVQAITYRKAVLFKSDDIAKVIMKVKRPEMCIRLGKSRKIDFNKKDWEEKRYIIYTEVLRDKFREPAARKELLKTGDKLLLYDSKHKWLGNECNNLGRILMEIREELKGD